MNADSGYRGSLWVTHHDGRKISGCESIMSTCKDKCEFKHFCYSERLQKVMRSSKEKAIHNRCALELEPSEFLAPSFKTDVVRWFSFGSCNGSPRTLYNVGTSVLKSHECNHAIWCEPQYWDVVNKYLKDIGNLNIVFSNKIIDSVKHIPDRITFNLASSMETYTYLMKQNPDSIGCLGKCSECGWKCYKLDSGAVIEHVNRRHGSPVSR